MKIYTDSDLQQNIEKNKFTVVDFWASWCGPCKSIAPLLEQLSGDYPNVEFAKINVDENPETSVQYNIRAIPTILLFRNGELQERLVGMQQYNVLKQKINSIL